VELIKGKCCRKCGSNNIYLDYDLGCWYEHCLICGYTAPLEEIEVVKEGKASLWTDNISIEA